MVCEEDEVTAGNKDCGPGMARRGLHPRVKECLPSTEGTNAQEPAWFEADCLERDAPISVWWDHPPSNEP